MWKLPRKSALASAIALVLSVPVPAMAQVFYEPFDISAQMPPQPGCNRGDFPGGAGTYPFPSGWLLRNVDNRTPSGAVAYVNEAWEVREDFSFDTSQCVAFSTSWYTPAGAADDWAWTPPIALPAGTSVLSWRAVAYDPSYRDGYEVRVMVSPNVPSGGTGVLGNQVALSSQVFTTAAENTAWTNHNVDLSAYALQTVYVGFHNNSTDKFLLLIDDVKVIDSTPNLVAVAAPGYAVDYAHVPAGVAAPLTPAVVASNQGAVTLTNVTGGVDVKLAGVTSFTLPATATIASIGIGASSTVTFPGSVLTDAGTWTLTYSVGAAQAEPNLLDNVIDRPGTTIGGNEWTRFEGPASGTLGIGAGNGGELGTQFTLTQTATFEGVRFGFTDRPPPDPPNVDTWPGNSVFANLRAVDAVTGKPADVIATTTSITTTTAGAVYDVWFTDGVQTLQPGTYAVTVVEPVGPDAIPLILAVDRYLPGTTWVNWPTSPLGGWGHFEDFGAGFARTPYVSLLSYVTLFKDGFEGAAPVAPVAAALPVHPSTPTRRRAVNALSRLPHD